MSKHNPGSHYIKIAEANGLRVVLGKGDHKKVYGPAGRGYMTIPMHKELADGTECAIKKFFKACGILLTSALIGAVILTIARIAA